MYQKIVVPLDGSALAECVLPHLESISRGCGAKEVVFINVVPEIREIKYQDAFGVGVVYDENAQKKAVEAAKKYLGEVPGKLNLSGMSVNMEIKVGPAADVITDYVKKSNADLVIMATHGRSGISRWAMGSTADKIVRTVCAPVFMIRAPGCIPGF